MMCAAGEANMIIAANSRSDWTQRHQSQIASLLRQKLAFCEHVMQRGAREHGTSSHLAIQTEDGAAERNERGALLTRQEIEVELCEPHAAMSDDEHDRSDAGQSLHRVGCARGALVELTR
jgi:hypothetical protein